MYHRDLEFLISRWSVESHTFIAARVRYARTCHESHYLTIVWRVECDGRGLGEEDKGKIQQLTSAMASSKSSRKSIYAS